MAEDGINRRIDPTVVWDVYRDATARNQITAAIPTWQQTTAVGAPWQPVAAAGRVWKPRAEDGITDSYIDGCVRTTYAAGSERWSNELRDVIREQLHVIREQRLPYMDDAVDTGPSRQWQQAFRSEDFERWRDSCTELFGKFGGPSAEGAAEEEALEEVAEELDAFLEEFTVIGEKTA